MLKVLSLFLIKVQFYGDELSEAFIHLTCCIKFVNCHIYDIKQEFFTEKEILPVFIKTFAFRRVGISLIIATKKQYSFQWINRMKNYVQ